MKKVCAKCGTAIGRAAALCLMCGTEVKEPPPEEPKAPVFKNVMDTESFVVPTGRRIVATWAVVAAVILACAAAASYAAR